MNVSALTTLAASLQGFQRGVSLSSAWRADQAIADVLTTIRRRHANKMGLRQRAGILDQVNEYLRTGEICRPENLITLCTGSGWLDEQGKGILADRERRQQVLVLAATLMGRKLRLKAFRGLLFAYWSFPLYGEATSAEALAGWQELRAWLALRHAEIDRHPSRKPSWFKAIGRHRYLLDEHPCARFAASLLRGNLDELQTAIDSLAIPVNSWLKFAAIMALVDDAVQRPDDSFRALVPALLNIATGQGGIRLTDDLSRRLIAKLTLRQARFADHEVNLELFQMALEKIGNPWRQRTAWDVHVRDERGNACVLAREMVGAWHKDRLIGEFFADAGLESSRGDLWQRYSVFIKAISIASSWPEWNEQALLLRVSDLLLIVPKNSAKPIDAYPWPIFTTRSGATLLDKAVVEGHALKAHLERRKPIMQSAQGNPVDFDQKLRRLLFSTSSPVQAPPGAA